MGRKQTIVVEDIADLRLVSNAEDQDIAFDRDTGHVYDFDGTLLDVDDGDLVVRPTALLAGQPGRWTRRSAAAGSVPVDALASTVGSLRDPGRRAVNVLRVASDVVDEQTVTIGADVYEFDRAADGVTAGRIAVTGHANDTPTAATDALIASINADGTEAVEAIDIGNNEILLVADAVGAVVLACTETLLGANNGWAAVAMYGGAAPATKKLVAQSRVPTAVEVALGNMHFLFDFVPVVIAVEVRVTASGLIVAWGGTIAVDAASKRVTLTNDTNPDWAATDTVKLVVTN